VIANLVAALVLTALAITWALWEERREQRGHDIDAGAWGVTHFRHWWWRRRQEPQ